MKKIILGLTLVLVLTSCQQPTIDYNNFSDSDPSSPKVELEQEDEHKALIEEYRDIFNEYKADLESKKETFEALYCWDCNAARIEKSECKYFDIFSKPHWYHKNKDGDDHNNIAPAIEYLEFLNNDLSYSHLLNYYEVEQPDLYHTRWNFSSAEMADAIRPFVESIKKDLEEVKAQFAEISSLLTEVNEVLNELDSMYIERIVANKIELEDKIENLQILDVHSLVVMYNEFQAPLFHYNPRDKDLYTHYDLYKRVFN